LLLALNLSPLIMGSLGSSTGTILLHMTHVLIIVTTFAYMQAFFLSMPLSSTNITSPRHHGAISGCRYSHLWQNRYTGPFCSVNPLAIVTLYLACPSRDPLLLTCLDPLLLTCLDPHKLPLRVKLLPLFWNYSDDCPLFPFFGREGLLVKNLKSLLLAPVAWLYSIISFGASLITLSIP